MKTRNAAGSSTRNVTTTSGHGVRRTSEEKRRVSGSERFRGQNPASSALTRSRVYKLFAIALAGPDEGWFVALKDGFFNAALETEFSRLGITGQEDNLLQLSSLLEAVTTEPAREQILQEYTNIFDLPSSAALPYETDHVAGHAFMKGDLITDILGFYKAFGLEISETEKERADYIVAELEFMHVLCLKEAAARTKYFGHIDLVVDAEKRFLTEHLGRWVDRFAVAVRDGKISPVYAAVLDIAQVFIQTECAALGVIPLPVSSILPVLEDAPGLCEAAGLPNAEMENLPNDQGGIPL